MKDQRESMKLEVLKGSIEYVTRLGRSRGQRLILVKFTSFSVKFEVLRKAANLTDSQIRADEDFSLETRKIWMGLISCLKDAKKSGLRVFLKDKLVVNGRTYDLDYVVKNVQQGVEGGVVKIPGRNRVEETKEIS
jgi:hypothetical protein